MELWKQIELWNENEQYPQIIRAIEALPETEQTPELISELAKAYNNAADGNQRANFEKAIALLKTVETQLGEDHNWNFRMAYAYYYLDQEGPALAYFERALKARPKDSDTQTFIEDCRQRLALPRFEKPMRQRVQESWRLFESEEQVLRVRMRNRIESEEIINQMTRLLHPAFPEIAFEMGCGQERYDLILTPEGGPVRLAALDYYQKQMPERLKKRWNVMIGRQPAPQAALRIAEQELTADAVQVWITEHNEKSVSLDAWCPSLAELMAVNENRVGWILSILIDQTLGEIAAMVLIDDLKLLSKPESEAGITLAELPAALAALKMNLDCDPARVLESYTAYRMEPTEESMERVRGDVTVGSTRCLALIQQYLHGETQAVDDLHKMGAAAGFFYYPLNGFTNADRAKAILDFREELEARIEEKAGAETVTWLGGASGVHCGYLDFIAWDIKAVLDAATIIFAEMPVLWAAFQTFRTQVGGILLKDDEE